MKLKPRFYHLNRVGKQCRISLIDPFLDRFIDISGKSLFYLKWRTRKFVYF